MSAGVENVGLEEDLSDAIAVVVVDAPFIVRGAFEGDAAHRCVLMVLGWRRGCSLSIAARLTRHELHSPPAESRKPAGWMRKKSGRTARWRCGPGASTPLDSDACVPECRLHGLVEEVLGDPEPGKPMTPFGSRLSS